MDPAAPPWRALEGPAQPRTDSAAPLATAPAWVTRPAVLAAGGAVLLGLLAFLLAFGTSAGGTVMVDGGAPIGSSVADTGSVGGPDSTAAGPDLVVEIVGAVDRPGVFRLAPGSRVGDLVDAAGGYGARVDTRRASRELNLAAPLSDGDKISVPSRDDEAPDGPPANTSKGESGTAAGATGPLNLNRATAAELEALPGIGPVTAGKILRSREEQPFSAVEELRTRKLLGEKTFEKLKDLVTVR